MKFYILSRSAQLADFFFPLQLSNNSSFGRRIGGGPVCTDKRHREAHWSDRNVGQMHVCVRRQKGVNM